MGLGEPAKNLGRNEGIVNYDPGNNVTVCETENGGWSTHLPRRSPPGRQARSRGKARPGTLISGQEGEVRIQDKTHPLSISTGIRSSSTVFLKE